MALGEAVVPIAVIVCVSVLVLASGAADARRKPTGSESATITREVLVELERDSPTVPIKMLAIEASTQRPGATSPYTKFATATFTGQDAQGNQLDALYAVLGFSKRFKVWRVIQYGSGDVGCGRQQAQLFGGRRSAIFRDLRLICTP